MHVREPYNINCLSEALDLTLIKLYTNFMAFKKTPYKVFIFLKPVNSNPYNQVYMIYRYLAPTQHRELEKSIYHSLEKRTLQ
jgi:hypothetical protein